MTYSKSMTLYAAAGLGMGPSGISPPFRRYGFRSFDGLGALGFDRLASGSSYMFVASISSVHGLPSSSAAPLVPSRIRESLQAAGFGNPMAPPASGAQVDAGWASGGRVWVKYAVPSGSSLLSNASARRAAVVQALASAARSIGPGVYFELSGYGRVPAGAASAPAETRPESGGAQIIELAPVNISGGFTTIRTSELQTLLRQKGFNPGTVDGVWGENTSGALQQAAERVGMGEAIAAGSDDKRSVQLGSALLSAIRALPNGTPPATPAPPRAAPVAELAPDEVFGGGGFPDWAPWAIGAGGLALIGGFFIYRGRRRAAVAANRRRRRRTSRRR